MRSAICRRAGEIALEEVPLPEPAREDVRLSVQSCGICGSDLHWYQGHSSPPRVCPGHEIVGVVEAVGASVASLEVGDRVVVEGVRTCGRCASCARGDTQRCRDLRIVGLAVPGGFAESVIAPARSVFRVPTGMSDRVASLAEPVAVAVHALDLAGVAAGHRVLVLGAGTIGLLAAALAVRAQAEVVVSARREHQRAAARDLGTAPVSAARLDEELPAGWEADAVIETVGGTGDTLQIGLEHVRPGGIIVVVGVFTEPTPLDAAALMAKEARLVGSMAYGRAGDRPDFAVALSVLSEAGGRLADRLVTHRFRLDEVDLAFRTAAEKREGAIKVLVEPGR
jgi:2-desacetyl-2-hydroxyethyl bacteriochlorophyllide A dehydrogenase